MSYEEECLRCMNLVSRCECSPSLRRCYNHSCNGKGCECSGGGKLDGIDLLCYGFMVLLMAGLVGGFALALYQICAR